MQSSIAALKPIAHEVIKPGLKREWFGDGNIVVITRDTNDRELVDLWADIILRDVQSWPIGKPYLVVFDFSNAFMTPYSRQKSENLIETVARLRGQTLSAAYAVVLPKSAIGSIVRLFVKRDLHKRYAQWNTEVFTDRADAIEWLLGYSSSLGRL